MVAAAFMLPLMRGFDVSSHGVEWVGRDFVVLGRLLRLLGTCMRCCGKGGEGAALAGPLMDFVSAK